MHIHIHILLYHIPYTYTFVTFTSHRNRNTEKEALTVAAHTYGGSTSRRHAPGALLTHTVRFRVHTVLKERNVYIHISYIHSQDTHTEDGSSTSRTQEPGLTQFGSGAHSNPSINQTSSQSHTRARRSQSQHNHRGQQPLRHEVT